MCRYSWSKIARYHQPPDAPRSRVQLNLTQFVRRKRGPVSEKHTTFNMHAYL